MQTEFSNNGKAPIVLFVYNRYEHIRRTIEALKQNLMARESDLIIFSDAPRSEVHTGGVDEVRQYIRRIEGFKTVTIVERETNLGLANSIIDGVTTIVNKYGRIIVLEDDMVTSPYFLTYMNDALEKYSDSERVVNIHAYVYPVDRALPESFFLRGADCWGWATWRRGWAYFNSDGQFLLDELKRRNLINVFDFNGSYPFSKMLEEQIKGANNSWAVRWYASAFLADKLTLYPGRSLLQNIGNDNSGTHCGELTGFDTNTSLSKINLHNINSEPSPESRQAFEDYFRKGQMGLMSRLARKSRALISAFGR